MGLRDHLQKLKEQKKVLQTRKQLLQDQSANQVGVVQADIDAVNAEIQEIQDFLDWQEGQ